MIYKLPAKLFEFRPGAMIGLYTRFGGVAPCSFVYFSRFKDCQLYITDAKEPWPHEGNVYPGALGEVLFLAETREDECVYSRVRNRETTPVYIYIFSEHKNPNYYVRVLHEKFPVML